MLRDLIKHFVSCFPKTKKGKEEAVKMGPCEPVEVSLESIIHQRKQELKADVEKECKKVTKRVVKESVRKELFAKYGMNEQKELDEYRDRYCRGVHLHDYQDYMEKRLVECIVEEMTQEVLSCINTQ
jgi:hypothetical protein